MRAIEVIPPVYFYVCIALLVVAHLILPLGEVLRFPWRLFGTPPLVAGIALDLIADKDFKRAGTSVKPMGKTTTLITAGVFRVSRHPMYLGFVLVLLGISVLLGSLSPLIITGAFAVFLEVVFVRFEESKLDKQFGETWREYRRKVRRWL